GVDRDFFDNTEPKQGLNQDWIRYANTADWDLFFKTVLIAQKNGDSLTFLLETKIESANDYKAGDEWNLEEVLTFDENDVLLVNGAEKFIIKYDNGRVEVNMTYIGEAPNPLVSELTGVMKLDVFEEGTFQNTYWLYSDYDASPNTWWKGIDATNRVIITNPSGNIFRLEALIVGDLLPDKFEFKITGRLYDNRAPVPSADAKLKEDGTLKQREASTGFKLLDP
ncbi:MAG: hypothetical protein IH823_03750, partial [Candidatus Dadabacteria bacterium]|nr:hypothetical protein [Candidatus Dadabacteria bacterium]